MKGHRILKIDAFDLYIFRALVFLFLISPSYFFYPTLLLQSQVVLISLVIGIVVIAGGLTYGISYLCYLNFNFFKKKRTYRLVLHYLLEHNIYSTKRIKSKSGVIEKIKLPRVYIHFSKTYDIMLSIERAGNKYDHQLERLGDEFEKLFVSDLKENYVTLSKNPFKRTSYINLVYSDNREAQRLSIHEINIDPVKGIELIRGDIWDFIHYPHLLLSGGTGSGKSILLFCLLKLLPQIGSVDICDPKKSDLASFNKFPSFKGHVFSEKQDIVDCLLRATEFMEERYRTTAIDPDQKIGKNYLDYDLAPHFVIIDELAAFMSSFMRKDYDERDSVEYALKQIAMKGRQAGVFLIIAMQRPDGEYLPTDVRDQFGGRIILGKNSATAYRMMFGEDSANKFFTFIKGKLGRGYASLSGQVPSEFYAPFVPFKDGYTFEEEFSKIEICEKGKDNYALLDGLDLPEMLEEDDFYSIDFSTPEVETKTVEQEPIKLTEEENISMGNWISKQQLSETIDKTKSQISYMKTAMKNVGYTFVNTTYYTKEDLEIFKALFDMKEETGESYSKVAKDYFDGR